MEHKSSGDLVQCSIELAEPVLFQKGCTLGALSSMNGTGEEQQAILRGKLVLRVIEAVKVKAIKLDFTGRSRNERHRGACGQFEEKDFIKHSWTFTRRSILPHSFGQETHTDLRTLPGCETSSPCGSYTPLQSSSIQLNSSSSDTPLDLDRYKARQKSLPFQSNRFQRHSTTKSSSHQFFEPGIYEYLIEFPIPRTCPETLKIGERYVNYQLEAFVKLHGVFRANIHKMKEIILVRVPEMDLLDRAGPILINNKWKDRLHYNLAIPSKSFPIGSKIPITLRLSSSQVRCHSVAVYLTENIQFFGYEDDSYRRAPHRKIKLLEESVESRYLGDFGDSEMDVPDEKSKLSTQTMRSEEKLDSEKNSVALTPMESNESPDSRSGPTKIELEAQLPSCHSMRESGPTKRLIVDTNWECITVTHWIKVILHVRRIISLFDIQT
ncbi:uncharacterized protein LY89DRAFT_739750 [Mollisia scopiformis]|uniref:Arrestin C-terminal-like domain-containing protein n=1 Tax=Mollisia scopiformis TaxID=149040 RepID=A0A194WS09_MOLSC|nr:uncharacterized protein LY89DRAFT_739750 [Mollisia scopiformis]KUJ10758.1 hypothetical protein LY89DRAFT_739750 [Mollisia scopiformis]